MKTLVLSVLLAVVAVASASAEAEADPEPGFRWAIARPYQHPYGHSYGHNNQRHYYNYGGHPYPRGKRSAGPEPDALANPEPGYTVPYHLQYRYNRSHHPARPYYHSNHYLGKPSADPEPEAFGIYNPRHSRRYGYNYNTYSSYKPYYTHW